VAPDISWVRVILRPPFYARRAVSHEMKEVNVDH
jgi:hypothetical protein